MSTKIDGTQQGNTLLESALAENGLKSYFQALYNTSGGMRIEFTVMGALKLKPYELFQFSALDSTPKAYKNRQFRITSISYDFVNNTSKVTGYQVGSRFVSANNTPKDPPLKRRQRAIETELYAVEDERFLEVLEDISGVDGETLKKANNLSDVASVSTSRDNLSVYSQAELDATQLQNEVDLVQLGLQDDALFLQKADKGIQITLSPSGGLEGGGTNDLSADSEFGVSIADSGVTTVKIADSNVTNAKLANSTISGKELGTNLDSLSAGNGLTGTAYNGSAPQTWAIDPTAPIKITGDKVDLGFVAPLILTGNDLDVQDAGVAQRGVVSIGAQTFAGNKTFQNEVLFKDLHKADNTDLTTDFTGIGWEGTHAGDFNIRNLVVRESARFRELIIDQLSAVGGSFLYSAARGKVKSISESVVTLEDPNDKGVSQWSVDDIFVVRIVDIDGGNFKFITGRVSAVSNPGAGMGNPTITLAQNITGTTGAIASISAGDVIVQRGNVDATKTTRHNAIYVSTTDSDAPSQKYFTGLTSIAAFNNEDSIKVQSGNLANITNATGFGFYGDNTFLTGSLLVGDLTKAGNHLEYTGSDLNVVANNISLTAVGDLAEAVLQINTDLVQLGLEAGGAYSGIQFLAGQAIISASSIDGQGRVKLATVRLDATGVESSVGIEADNFLLKTNGLTIDSAEFIQLGENFVDNGGVLISTGGTLFADIPNKSVYIQASDGTAGRPRTIAVKSDANNFFQYYADNDGWDFTLKQIGVQVMRFDSEGTASISGINGDIKLNLNDDKLVLKSGSHLLASLGSNGLVFNQGPSFNQGINWNDGETMKSAINSANDKIRHWASVNSASAGHEFITKRGDVDTVAVQILRDKMIIGSSVEDVDDYELEFVTLDDTDYTIGTIQEYMIVRFNGTKRAIAMHTATADTPPPAIPSAPTSPTLCKDTSPDVLRLKWTNSAGTVDYYNIYRSETTGSGYSLVSSVGDGAVGYDDPNAPFFPTTTYYYRVTAVNDGGESAPSVEAFSSYNGASAC